MNTLADLIDIKTKEYFEKIIADEKARALAEWEEWQRREREHVERTHFKTPEEMIDWVLSGKSIYNGEAEMKLSEDKTAVMHYGQHSDEYDAVFWWQWTSEPIDQWKEWVYKIAQPDYREFGYMPVWEKGLN